MSADRLDSTLTAAVVFAEALERSDLAVQLRQLRDRRRANEWFVLLLGETSSGKSSWLNSLLDEPILPATPGTTTGIPVEVRWSDRSEPEFACVTRDGRRRSLLAEEFRAACVGRSADALRLLVNWPLARRHPAVAESDVRGLVVVDAPGYNSCVGEHVEILRDVLPEADAVVGFVNAVRGVTPQDLEFLHLVRNFGDGASRLSFVVNWLPSGGGTARVPEMHARISEGLGGDFRLHPLTKQGAGTSLRLWSSELWQSLVDLAQAPDRRARSDQNVALVGSAILEDLADTLSLRARVAAVEEEKLGRVDRAILEIQQKRVRATEVLAAGERDMHRAVLTVSSAGRDGLWTEADATIDEANRFTEITSCTTWVRAHLLPLHFERTAQRMATAVEQVGDQTAQQIEDLFADAELIELPDIEASDPQWEGARNHLARRGVHAAATELIAGQLGAFGGRGGAKAGFYNLSKKVVAKVGRVFGKKFSRAFYNNLGRALRRVGLSAGTAMALFASVVLEATAYLYQAARWKAKLRGVMQHTLGLPAVDEPLEDKLLRQLPIVGGERKRPFELLADESRAAISDAMEASREILDANLERRADVLAKALASRRSGDADAVPLSSRIKELTRIAEALEEESKWEATTS